MAAFKRKPLLTLVFLKHLGQEFRLIAVFGAFLWFRVQVIMHASIIKRDCTGHWATSAGSRTRWGNIRMVRKAGYLLRALQWDCGVGIQSLGLTEIPCVVFSSYDQRAGVCDQPAGSQALSHRQFWWLYVLFPSCFHPNGDENSSGHL